ncbi:hypothetical protein C1I98_32795 [Spongiactinospora gelatinilytica]|uniref:Uncharacterized protein n=1 Tax=Spongiactinospora gelatinilytica TaxID=2666298 RepID=A0A2W2FEW1_9ACTN|nr:hypothetical protein C1I98_32795 [Spongiactinospora gelatinilytica]
MSAIRSIVYPPQPSISRSAIVPTWTLPTQSTSGVSSLAPVTCASEAPDVRCWLISRWKPWSAESRKPLPSELPSPYAEDDPSPIGRRVRATSHPLLLASSISLSTMEFVMF